MFRCCFSALQRAEIAEINGVLEDRSSCWRFSALQRAEIAEILPLLLRLLLLLRFSALQRAEIAEIIDPAQRSVIEIDGFSALQRAEIAEIIRRHSFVIKFSFSALQRAEIAEILPHPTPLHSYRMFQCSSTSRNC